MTIETLQKHSSKPVVGFHPFHSFNCHLIGPSVASRDPVFDHLQPLKVDNFSRAAPGPRFYRQRRILVAQPSDPTTPETPLSRLTALSGVETVVVQFELGAPGLASRPI